jgi:D-alanyl-D-alanine carboxypeptidase (penicillin-binding protein 5/6)
LVLGNGGPAASPDEEPVAIASLAKVITAYLTLTRYPLSGAHDGFTITVIAAQAQAVAQERAEGQSVVAVAAGEQLTERQLLEALLIPSGNNIAQTLADQVAGSETSFVAEMNAEARVLGMDHTTYTDPSGFDPGTVSTAADQLRVLRRRFSPPPARQPSSSSPPPPKWRLCVWSLSLPSLATGEPTPAAASAGSNPLPVSPRCRTDVH